MDVALAIFNIGAGLGVLAAGGALVYLAWQTTPLIRESRGLTAELRELVRTTDRELRPILADGREVAANAELLAEDMAVKLERLEDVLGTLQRGLEQGRLPVGGGRPDRLPVESWQTREDPSGS